MCWQPCDLSRLFGTLAGRKPAIERRTQGHASARLRRPDVRGPHLKAGPRVSLSPTVFITPPRAPFGPGRIVFYIKNKCLTFLPISLTIVEYSRRIDGINLQGF